MHLAIVDATLLLTVFASARPPLGVQLIIAYTIYPFLQAVLRWFHQFGERVSAVLVLSAVAFVVCCLTVPALVTLFATRDLRIRDALSIPDGFAPVSNASNDELSEHQHDTLPGVFMRYTPILVTHIIITYTSGPSPTFAAVPQLARLHPLYPLGERPQKALSITFPAWVGHRNPLLLDWLLLRALLCQHACAPHTPGQLRHRLRTCGPQAH